MRVLFVTLHRCHTLRPRYCRFVNGRGTVGKVKAVGRTEGLLPQDTIQPNLFKAGSMTMFNTRSLQNCRCTDTQLETL
jgi:hypothetical protein